ncbi:MAG: lipoprotein [Oceanospirillaceae bacterium]
MKNYKLLLKLSVFTSILWLVGCGQKGPLYIEKEAVKETVESTIGEAPSETSVSE